MMGNVDPAKRLRRAQADAERVISFQLRGRRRDGLKFMRQVPIDRFVVGFCCSKLASSSSSMADNVQREQPKTQIEQEFLRRSAIWSCVFGTTVCCRTPKGVREEILSTARQYLPRAPHRDPLPRGEREKEA
jgi:hypothetical protein